MECDGTWNINHDVNVNNYYFIFFAYLFSSPASDLYRIASVECVCDSCVLSIRYSGKNSSIEKTRASYNSQSTKQLGSYVARPRHLR